MLNSHCTHRNAGLLMLLYPFVPETPYWLVHQGNNAAADAVLHKMAQINGVSLPKVPSSIAAALCTSAGRIAMSVSYLSCPCLCCVMCYCHDCSRFPDFWHLQFKRSLLETLLFCKALGRCHTHDQPLS